MLCSDLSSTVLLHLSEGIGETVEVIALLTQLGLSVLQGGLVQLICGRGGFRGGLTHALRCLLKLTGLSVLSGFVGTLRSLLGAVAGSL